MENRVLQLRSLCKLDTMLDLKQIKKHLSNWTVLDSPSLLYTYDKLKDFVETYESYDAKETIDIELFWKNFLLYLRTRFDSDLLKLN